MTRTKKAPFGRRRGHSSHGRGAGKMLRKIFQLELFDVALLQQATSSSGASESAIVRAALRLLVTQEAAVLALVHREQVEWAARPDLHGGRVVAAVELPPGEPPKS